MYTTNHQCHKSELQNESRGPPGFKQKDELDLSSATQDPLLLPCLLQQLGDLSQTFRKGPNKALWQYEHMYCFSQEYFLFKFYVKLLKCLFSTNNSEAKGGDIFRGWKDYKIFKSFILQVRLATIFSFIFLFM